MQRTTSLITGHATGKTQYLRPARMGSKGAEAALATHRSQSHDLHLSQLTPPSLSLFLLLLLLVMPPSKVTATKWSNRKPHPQLYCVYPSLRRCMSCLEKTCTAIVVVPHQHFVPSLLTPLVFNCLCFGCEHAFENRKCQSLDGPIRKKG